MSSYEPRDYRDTVGADDLVSFEVSVAETDLMVLAREPLREQARTFIREARRQIESHAVLRPEFLTARSPLPLDEAAPLVPHLMYRAAVQADTGPMAAVAGAVAEFVARQLRDFSDEVIVENGGDLFLISARERLVAVRAGGSRFDGKLALAVPAGELAVCTSSGTIGHSASAGRADAVVIAADDGAFADAMATAVANRVSGPADAEDALAWARTRGEIRHALIICADTMAAWGDLEIRNISA